MKCLKKFVALGLCLSMVPCYSTDAVRSGMLGTEGKKEDTIKFYNTLQLNERFLFSFWSGGLGIDGTTKDAIKFYNSLQLHEMVLSSPEGLSLICCLLEGESLVVNPSLNVGVLVAHLVEVHNRYVSENRLEDLRKLILDNKKKLYDLTVDSFGEALLRDRAKEGRLLDIKQGYSVAVRIVDKIAFYILSWECKHSKDPGYVHFAELKGDDLYDCMVEIFQVNFKKLNLSLKDRKCLLYYLCSNNYDALNLPKLGSDPHLGRDCSFFRLPKKIQEDVWCVLGCCRIQNRI